MGGYGAVKIALKHPDLYGSVSALSGAIIPFGWDELPALQLGRALHADARLRPHRRGELARRQRRVADPLGDSASTGRRSTSSCAPGPRTSTASTASPRSTACSLNEHGVPTTVLLEPGGHDWDYWRRAMQEILRVARRAV